MLLSQRGCPTPHVALALAVMAFTKRAIQPHMWLWQLWLSGKGYPTPQVALTVASFREGLSNPFCIGHQELTNPMVTTAGL